MALDDAVARELRALLGDGFVLTEPEQFRVYDCETFGRLRRAVDPDGLANPGKVLPTPRLCGEVPGPYRMHPLERIGVAERF